MEASRNLAAAHSAWPRVLCRYSLVLLILGMFPIEGVAGDKSKSAQDGTIDFGAQYGRLDGGCIGFSGVVSSGTFFNHLKRTGTDGHVEFTKDNRMVTEYPESLRVEIRIAGGPCGPGHPELRPSILAVDADPLRFRVEWKEGMQLKPAIQGPIAVHCSYSPGSPWPGFGLTVKTCQMAVDGKGVPLVDHLIVSLLTANGTTLVRLSAAP